MSDSNLKQSRRPSATRLDRWLAGFYQKPQAEVRLLIAAGRVALDGQVCLERQARVTQFSKVVVDGEVLQALQPLYLLLNKPAGVVSATKDPQHQTVIDLVDHPQASTLHIAGRLDKHSSGMVLLTNDGQWSRSLTLPESKVTKHYRVRLGNSVQSAQHRLEYQQAFIKGMHFDFEDMQVQAESLEFLSEDEVEVVLTQGRYHQIKRMFGVFRNPVIELHRFRIGDLALPSNLHTGQWKSLSEQELAAIKSPQ
ncbi:pseudouridine synthase [Paraferrimonas sedimenticola]|uniref:Ribosomal small subunit pseudouridine synthase A n=1 Tax=Paraferrimonas sedimenticola TaxID=375674 RepID=A0AA37S067_9GAMM|nr:16S rRNA pseudouridine(516) synthase [Paraferrimonas sedimenticola]GLP97862.1 pseudouridine synthase [Paraferrimonas sedimenticola]